MATTNGSSEKSRTVIVGVDVSHRAEHAFDWYVEHLHRSENYVMVVHTVEVQHVAPHQSIFSTPEMWQEKIDKEKQMSKELENKYTKKLQDKKVKGGYKWCGGKPGEVLVRLGNEEKAEMIVVGTRGHGKIRRTILGSVSDYVVHHAHCPVITVRKSVPI